MVKLGQMLPLLSDLLSCAWVLQGDPQRAAGARRSLCASLSFVCAVFIVCLSLPPVGSADDSDPGKSFAEAYALFTSGNYAEARDLFHKTASPQYPLSDHSLYYLSAIAFEEGDWDAARRFIAQLRRHYQLSLWYHRAELLRAKIEIAASNYAEAVDILTTLRSGKVTNEIPEEALFLQAQAQEAQGDTPGAHALFQELRNLAPRSPWAAAARKEVARLRETRPEEFGLFTVTAIAEEADLLVREREHGAAERLYKKILSQDLGASLRLQFLAKLSRLYLSVRNRNEALPLLEEIARDFPDSPEAATALFRIGQIFWNRNENIRALEYFKRAMDGYPASTHSDQAHFAAADIYESLGQKEPAIALYRAIPKKFPHSSIRSEATWRLAWLYYRSGEHLRALQTFKRLAARAKEDRFRTASLYWQARSAEKIGMTETGAQIYQQIYLNGEESYYQSLAANRLTIAGKELREVAAATPSFILPSVEEEGPDKSSAVDEQGPPLTPEVDFHLIRARELTRLGLRTPALAELDEARLMGQLQPRLNALLMRQFARNEAYARSVAMTNLLPSSSRERNLYRFPLAYWHLIQAKAQEKGLDPFLVVSLIRQESLFDARARSPAAALGLMQLLPSTAARMAEQSGLGVPSNDQLFEPEINIALGTEYLKDLLQRYSNNWFKAIAAYNAGEAAVDRWEKEIPGDDSEEFVERIPYLETRQYVKLVIRNHRIYKRLYDR